MYRIVWALLVGLCVSAPAVAETKPNILFIFADDWGWGDLGCHGHPYVKTPNIDRLAAEGTDFHRFTVASGVCSPSRTAVMTGHFPARYNIDGHFAWVQQNEKRNMPDWLDPNVPLLSRFLKQAGYATAKESRSSSTCGSTSLIHPSMPYQSIGGVFEILKSATISMPRCCPMQMSGSDTCWTRWTDCN